MKRISKSGLYFLCSLMLILVFIMGGCASTDKNKPKILPVNDRNTRYISNIYNIEPFNFQKVKGYDKSKDLVDTNNILYDKDTNEIWLYCDISGFVKEKKIGKTVILQVTKPNEKKWRSIILFECADPKTLNEDQKKEIENTNDCRLVNGFYVYKIVKFKDSDKDEKNYTDGSNQDILTKSIVEMCKNNMAK